MPSRLPSFAPLALVLGCYGLAIAIVNPMRETAFSDDWAFALTVRRLLETGVFRMHDWSAPNTPFQTYWGAAIAWLLGYSFVSLRAATLLLMLVGVIAFYGLAREHQFNPRQAAVLTLVFLASPLSLQFSFTFMTDVPFLACVVTGLWLYTRALRLQSLALALLGSIAAAAAILTRQFGLAFVPGLLLVWWVSPERRRLVPVVLAAVMLPVVATAIQGYMAVVHPNWAAPWVTREQADYIRAVGALIPQTMWRVGVVLEYLALFCLPLVPLALADFAAVVRIGRAPRASQRGGRVDMLLTASLVAFLVAVNLYGAFVLEAGFLMPVLPWNFTGIAGWPWPAVAALSLVAAIGAVLFARIMVWRYLEGWRALSPQARLIDAVTFCLLAFQLMFFQFGDEYLLPLLPYALIVIGRGLLSWLDRWQGRIVATAFCILIVTSFWTRGMLAGFAAHWQAGEDLVAAGVAPDRIYSDMWEWNSYHGAFDAYARECKCADDPLAYSNYFGRWLPARLRSARYVIKQFKRPPPNPRVEVAAMVHYRDALLRRQTVFALKVRDPSPE